MGTNYYYETPAGGTCPTCGHEDEGGKLHIGKSSAGWAFSLHIIPSEGLLSLADWIALWAQSQGQIRDEYGEHVSVPEMVAEITERSFPRGAAIGTGLKRHGGVKVQPGEPTYDLIDYEFS